MIIVPGPLCWKTLSVAAFAPPVSIVIIWLDDEPSSVAASSPTSSHQTLRQRARSAAVDAVGGRVADDHVGQRAAVGDLEQRTLALVLAAAAQRARADEALHAAVVGAADVDRRADRLAAVRGRPGAEVRRRAAAGARRAAARRPPCRRRPSCRRARPRAARRARRAAVPPAPPPRPPRARRSAVPPAPPPRRRRARRPGRAAAPARAARRARRRRRWRPRAAGRPALPPCPPALPAPAAPAVPVVAGVAGRAAVAGRTAVPGGAGRTRAAGACRCCRPRRLDPARRRHWSRTPTPPSPESVGKRLSRAGRGGGHGS